MFVLARPTGEDIGRITHATDRGVAWRLNGIHTATVTMPLTDTMATEIDPGRTRLKVYREFTRSERSRVPALPARQLVLYAYLPDTGVTEDAATKKATLQFMDPRAVLARRYSSPLAHAASPVLETFTGQDQEAILWGLIDTQNNRAGGDTFITRGGAATGVLYTVTFDRRAVADSFTQMTQLLDGPDVDIDPVDGWRQSPPSRRMGDLRVYNRQGSDRPDAVFRFGSGIRGNCAGMRRTRMPVTTQSQMIGTDRATGGKITDTYGDPASSLYGLLERYSSEPDATDVGYLQFRTRGEVEAFKTPRQVVEITDPLPNGPRFQVDYFLGDTVRAACRVGSMRFADQTLRVHGVDVRVDQNGRESVNVTTAEI